MFWTKRTARRLALSVAVMAFGLLVLPAAAQRVAESTDPDPSPTGAQRAIVDLIANADGGYPNRMTVRITDAAGTRLRQRTMDASQIRFIRGGRWLDPRTYAIEYNISKNSAGVVYFDSETAQALQVETVTVARPMAATGQLEFELTSLDVYEHKDVITHWRNIVFANGSAFPIVIPKWTVPDDAYFPPDFRASVQSGVAAYRQFAQAKGFRDILVEQGSESIAPDNSAVTALACVDGQPSILIVPLRAPSIKEAYDQTIIRALDSAIRLACTRETTASAETAGSGEFFPFRFASAWKEDGRAAVEIETFGSEEEEATRKPVILLTRDGKLEQIAPVVTPTPVPEDAQTSALLELSEDGKTASGESQTEATKTPVPEEDARNSVAATPKPTARPTPKPTAKPRTARTPKPTPRATSPRTTSNRAPQTNTSQNRTNTNTSTPRRAQTSN